MSNTLLCSHSLSLTHTQCSFMKYWSVIFCISACQMLIYVVTLSLSLNALSWSTKWISLSFFLPWKHMSKTSVAEKRHERRKREKCPGFLSTMWIILLCFLMLTHSIFLYLPGWTLSTSAMHVCVCITWSNLLNNVISVSKNDFFCIKWWINIFYYNDFAKIHISVSFIWT